MTGRSILRVLALVVIGMTIASGGVLVAQNEITVEVSLSPSTIGMDEQAILTIVVSGEEQDLPQPNMPGLSMFEVYSQGHSSSFSLQNGKMSSSHTYRFSLIPKRAGTFPIKNIAVVHKNRRYKGDDVTLTVLPQSSSVSKQLEDKARTGDGQRRTHFLEAEIDNDNPYVYEQVTLTLKLFIGMRAGVPSLDWPAATDFWPEDLGRAIVHEQRINNRDYRVYEIKRALFPTRSGELEIGRGRFTAEVGGGFFRVGETISAHSLPIKINVRPLPTNGKPSDFTGTIGRFKMGAAVDKTDVELNQPITVTVRISGTGHIKSVAEPEIPESDDFRVYRASTKENITKANNRLAGTKIFEEVFVPRRTGDLGIPALTYNFFNPQTGRYEELKTRPIPITVSPGEGFAESDEVPYAPTSMSIGNKAADIRYLKDDIGQLSSVGSLPVFDVLYGVINGVPVIVLLGLIAVRMRKKKLSSDIGYARSRAATRQARKRLTKARSLADCATVTDFYAEISQALLSFVADKMNISPHGLTRERVAELLTERGADRQLVDDTVDVLRKSDFARYAPSSITQQEIDASLQTAEGVMTRLGEVHYA